MVAFNRTIVAGNLTRDPELKYTQSGLAVCSLSLAINDRVKRNGEWVDEPVFVDISLFGRTAENAAQYLSKGSPCLVEGRLKLDQWTDQESGQKRSKLKVVGLSVQFLGGRGGNSQQQAQGGYQQGQQQQQGGQGGYQQQGQQQPQGQYQGPPDSEIPS